MGIAELRAWSGGLVLRFTRPVDPSRAGRAENYRISSFTRLSTPAYGGPDRNRREEPVRQITVSGDGRVVRLELARPLRRDYVYEVRVQPLIEKGVFFPAEAYYTVRRVPQDGPAVSRARRP